MDLNLREVAGVLLLLGSAVFFLIGFGIAAARPRMAGSGGGRTDEGLRMSFDYRLRPGLATSRNALRLMQMIGIEVKEKP